MEIHMPEELRLRVVELRSRIKGQEAKVLREASTQTDAASAEMADLEAELDTIVASDCIYCGSIMIDSITQPFVTKEDAGDVVEWSC